MANSAIRTLVGAVVVCGSVGLAQAQVIDFSTSNFAMTGIGADAAGSDFDKLTFTGLSRSGFDVSVPVIANIGSLAFEVGENCDVGTCVVGPNISPPVNLTVNGSTHQFTLPFFWDVSETADTVTFSKPAPLIFTLAGGAKLTVDFLVPGTLVATAFDTQYIEPVQAKFTMTSSVPEPEHGALLVAGLFVIAWRKIRGRD